jgi:predicted secreted protein
VSLSTSIAIYFVIWWVALFAALPWGVRSQQESGDIVPGTDPGAPSFPALRRKLVLTTIMATVVFLALDVVYTYQWLTLESLTKLFGGDFSRYELR